MMRLTHGNKCPVCGKEWEAEGNLVPNTKDREFYGGRIKFFKDVTCDCNTKYTLFIGKKDTNEGYKYPVIDMMLRDVTDDVIKSLEEAEEKKIKYDITTKDGNVYESKAQKNEVERATILATIIDKDTKLAKLEELTLKELREQLKRRKIKFMVTESKRVLAEKLLAKDPNVVVAQQ